MYRHACIRTYIQEDTSNFITYASKLEAGMRASQGCIEGG